MTTGLPQQIVKESIFFVPHFVFPFTDTIHARGDPEKVLDEFHGNVLVDGIVNRELRRNFQHVLTEHRHPGCAVSLFEVASGWKRLAAVED